MTKLLDIRTVYDVDPTKTFRIADILENGAILPHSVSIAELMVMDLEPADDDKSEHCLCYEHIGDNPLCPDHWQIYAENEGSDSSMLGQLESSGYGSGGIL